MRYLTNVSGTVNFGDLTNWVQEAARIAGFKDTDFGCDPFPEPCEPWNPDHEYYYPRPGDSSIWTNVEPGTDLSAFWDAYDYVSKGKGN